MKGIEALENMVSIQSSVGNWNCNPYMWGMANGLILALATMKDEEPKYIDKPDVWLDDLPQTEIKAVEAERNRAQKACEQMGQHITKMESALLKIAALIETQVEPDIDAMHDVVRDALMRSTD